MHTVRSPCNDDYEFSLFEDEARSENGQTFVSSFFWRYVYNMQEVRSFLFSLLFPSPPVGRKCTHLFFVRRGGKGSWFLFWTCVSKDVSGKGQRLLSASHAPPPLRSLPCFCVLRPPPPLLSPSCVGRSALNPGAAAQTPSAHRTSTKMRGVGGGWAHAGYEKARGIAEALSSESSRSFNTL